MRIKVKDTSKIYIVAPSGVATGGPELLHQLGYKLISELGYKDVYMYYYPTGKSESPIHAEYIQYNIPFVTEIIDNEDNILIVPEVAIGLFNKYISVKKIIWWLSVDNYYFNIGYLKSKINRLLLKMLNSQNYLFFDENLKNIKYHLVQSKYAEDMLLNKGIKNENIKYLSDYLNVDFLRTETDLSEKQDIVVYNPKKGYKFTKRLIDYVKNTKKDTRIKFVPIQSMTRGEVISLLQKAKVYIDFGYFPGKDRIPREAVILGCCVLISRMGSGGYQQDFPIPDIFKLKIEDSLDSKYIKLITLLDNYAHNSGNLDSYRNMIRKEENIFSSSLEELFSSGS